MISTNIQLILLMIYYFYNISENTIGSLRILSNEEMVITNDPNVGTALHISEGFIHSDYWYLFNENKVYIICPGIESIGTSVRYYELNVKDINKCGNNTSNGITINCISNSTLIKIFFFVCFIFLIFICISLYFILFLFFLYIEN